MKPSIANSIQFSSVRHAMPHVAFLAVMVFFFMFSRALLSPLLVFIQQDLSITSAQVSRFFLPMSIMFSVAVLSSGILTEHIQHLRTISLSVFLIGLGFIGIALSYRVWSMQLSFLIIGAGAGLYPPSGITSLTAVVHPRIRGKTIAIHELGPNTAFIAAPLIVLHVVRVANWRIIPAGSGLLAFIVAALFYRFSIMGRFSGTRLRFHLVKKLFATPAFWSVTLLFILGVIGVVGSFSIMPLYLVNIKGYDFDRVNSMLSLSRVFTLFMGIISGWLFDKFGVRRLIRFSMISAGIITIGMGIFTGDLLLAAVFLQPIVITPYVPAILSASSDIAPPETRNLTFMVMSPFISIFAQGMYPATMGWLAEQGIASIGFIVTGFLFIFLSLLLVPLLHEPSK